MKTKEQIKEEIRSIERRLSMRREAAAYWMRMIELSKHNIQTFYPDPYESITIGDYISELEEARLSFTNACQDIHRLKKERNNLQRKQNSF
jgi:hypothetical protein